MGALIVPQAAIDLAKRFEGFHRVASADPGSGTALHLPGRFWTIGYGHLARPQASTDHGEPKPMSIWRTIYRWHWQRRCAIARFWPPNRRRGWRPSWISPSTSARGGCRRRRCGGESISGTGQPPRPGLRRWVYGGGKCCRDSSLGTERSARC